MNRTGRRIGAVAAVLLAVAAVCLLQRWQAQQTAYTKDIFAMDTYFALKAYGPRGEMALKLCEDEVVRLEKAFSVTNSDSDVSIINRQGEGVVCEDTFSLVSRALEICKETDGALDITLYPVLREWGFTTEAYRVPAEEEIEILLEKVDYEAVVVGTEDYRVSVSEGMELDLGAVAKGYTGDSLIEIMQECGVESAMVDLGGNVQVLGSKPDGSPWKVAVRNPYHPDRVLGVLEITDKAVITSGSYERYFEENGEKYGHILDPKDGYPAHSGLVSVTIIGDEGARCDGLSTALFVMGKEKAVEFWRKAGDFEMILVTEEGQLYLTEGLQDCFVSGEEWNEEIVYR